MFLHCSIFISKILIFTNRISFWITILLTKACKTFDVDKTLHPLHCSKFRTSTDFQHLSYVEFSLLLQHTISLIIINRFLHLQGWISTFIVCRHHGVESILTITNGTTISYVRWSNTCRWTLMVIPSLIQCVLNQLF